MKKPSQAKSSSGKKGQKPSSPSKVEPYMYLVDWSFDFRSTIQPYQQAKLMLHRKIGEDMSVR